LAARGWEKEAETAVRIAPLSEILRRTEPSTVVAVELQRPPTPEWFRTYAVAEGFSQEELAAREAIIGRIHFPVAGALAAVDNRPAGVGLGVLLDDWLGIFCVGTAYSVRRRGVAITVMRALAEWGHHWGAEQAFLQIMLDNGPGRSLYQRLGFTTAYHYHYRTCTDPSDDDPTGWVDCHPEGQAL
jgi:GNAT superfamily N-acetyltransferase